MPESRSFYGWKLLAALAVIVSINMGMNYAAAGVIIAPMAKDLGLSRGTLGLGSTVFLLCFGLTAPLVARAVNSLGARVSLCIGSLLVALGSILLATVARQGWHFVVCYGLLLGTGCAFGAMIPAQSCVTIWFEKRRAIALALVLVGAGLGGSISSPLLARFIAASQDNWRVGWFCLFSGALMAAVMSMLLVKNSPEEIGQVTDGNTRTLEEVSSDVALQRSRIYRTQDHWTVGDAMRTPVFWLLTLAAIGESAPGTAAVAHAIPHLRDLGHTPTAAGAALGFFSVCSIAGSLIAGFLCDRMDPRASWALCISVIGCGMFVATRADSELAMYAFTGMVGFGSGAALISWQATIGNYFGPTSFASILCAQLPVSNTIAAASPVLVGLVYDASNTYTPAFVGLGALSFVTAFFLYFANPPLRSPSCRNVPVIISSEIQ
jgi:cyanate permease